MTVPQTIGSLGTSRDQICLAITGDFYGRNHFLMVRFKITDTGIDLRNGYFHPNPRFNV
jgi:hypothetical protein